MSDTEIAQHASPGGAERAKPHGFGRCAVSWIALVACPALACSPTSAEDPRVSAGESSRADPTALLDELYAAYRPVPLEATSDKHDAALERQRGVMERLVAGDRALGQAAMATFRASEGEPLNLRSALLEVAARCDTQGSVDVLAHMVVTYDARLGLGLRTRAAELLAATSPERALEVLGPLCVEEKEQATLPPRETLVRAWAAAARAVGRGQVDVLTDVATNIAQVPDARYAAIHELGRAGGLAARQALEEVLFEGASDAYLRRKAAQALQAFLPPAELCPILERAASHEHDEIFLSFLADMLAKSCP